MLESVGSFRRSANAPAAVADPGPRCHHRQPKDGVTAPIDLRIERLHNTYRVAAAASDPEALRERLDACAREHLAEAIDRRLPAVMAALGLGPETEVAIGALRVRVRIRGDVEPAALAEAWGESIADALRSAIEPLASAGGGASARAAVFGDRYAAELEVLRELSLGLPLPWWAGAILAPRDGVAPAAAAILARWLDACPERVPVAVAELLSQTTLGLDRLLSEEEAQAIFAALLAVRSSRLRQLAEGIAGGGQPASARPPAPDAAVTGEPFAVRRARALFDRTTRAALRRTRAARARLLQHRAVAASVARGRGPRAPAP
jgi:hypothetical protein